jgi:hypothetical protein
LLGRLVGHIARVCVILDRVCLLAKVDSAGLGWVVLQLSRLAVLLWACFTFAILTRVVRIFLTCAAHDEVESSASESIELVTNSITLCCWSLALVEPLEKVVSTQTPQEEEACCKSGEEDSREENDQSDDDHEESETNSDKQADQQGDDEREDKDSQGEEDEQEQRRAGQGDVGEEEGLACLSVCGRGSAQRWSTYRQLGVFDSKLLELGQKLLAALWRED